jgi:hypothetical protein
MLLGRARFILTVAPLLLAANGCAGMQFVAAFDRVGEQQAVASPHAVATSDQVKVHFLAAPPGFSLKENELKVEDGFAHRILGRVAVRYEGGFCDVGPNAHKGREPLIRIARDKTFEMGGNDLIYVTTDIPDNATVNDLCNALVHAHGRPVLTGWAVIVAPST